MTYLTKLNSPLGPLSLASDGEAVTGLWLEGQKYFAAGLEAETENQPALPAFRQAEAWLDAYFKKQALPPPPPLAPKGSAFRQRVWKLLLEIPFGETSSYGALTEQLKAAGIPAAPQAVGGAVGHNPISIFIPCHRVVGVDGSLTGYAGGVEKKRLLLELEGADLSRLYTPKKGTAL
nr:methylated-DNA--[protein]-cysteine S-methyltransferase [uncultured Oscillibacter sp.]